VVPALSSSFSQDDNKLMDRMNRPKRITFFIEIFYGGNLLNQAIGSPFLNSKTVISGQMPTRPGKARKPKPRLT
jgi:hypothetical protein